MHQNRITLAIDKRQLNRMHIIFGGDSKHLEKDRNQICFKRECTLALILFVDVLVRIFDVVDLDHDLGLVLTSTPDPTGKKQIPER